MAKIKFIDKFGEDSSDNRHYIQLTVGQVKELQHLVDLAFQIQTSEPHMFPDLNREFNSAKHAFMAAIADELKLHYSYVGKRLEALRMESNPYHIAGLQDLLVIQGNEPTKWTANIYLMLPIDEEEQGSVDQGSEEEGQMPHLPHTTDTTGTSGTSAGDPISNHARQVITTSASHEWYTPTAAGSQYDCYCREEEAGLMIDNTYVLVDGISLITLPVDYKGFIQCPWYASIVPCDPSTMSYRVVLWKHLDYGEIEIAEHTHLVHGETFSDVQAQAANVLGAHLEQLGYLLLMGEVPAINGDLDRQFGDTVLLEYHRDVVEAYSDA